MSGGSNMPNSLEERLSSLPSFNRTALRQLWKELFGSQAPFLRREPMIPILGYRLQEQYFGALSDSCRSRLTQQVRALATNSNVSNGRQTALRAGTRLIRQWNKQTHVVTIESAGYEYQGVRYRSLSQIARQITGTRWSGPLFFGVKDTQSTNRPRVIT